MYAIAIHDRVTSEVNIAKKQMANFFSRLKTLAGEWRCLAAYIIVVVLSNEFERAILTIKYLP